MASGQWQSTSDADAARRQGPTPREASEAVPPVNEDQRRLELGGRLYFVPGKDNSVR